MVVWIFQVIVKVLLGGYYDIQSGGKIAIGGYYDILVGC